MGAARALGVARARRLVAPVLGLLFAVLGGSAWVVRSRLQADLTEAAYGRREALAVLSANLLKEKFERVVDVGVALATRVRFRQLAAEGRWEEAVRIMDAVPKDLPVVDHVLLADARGVLRADTPAQPGLRGKNLSDSDWYRGVSRGWKPYVSQAYRRPAGPRRNVVAVAVPIKAEDKSPAGVLVLELPLTGLLGWSARIDPAGRSWVVDKAGQLVSHPALDPAAPLRDLSGFALARRLLRGERGVELGPAPLGAEEVLSAFEPVAGFGWGVAVEQPSAMAFAYRDAVNRLVGVLFAAIFLVAALLALLVAQTLKLYGQRDRLARIVDSSSDAILGLDRDGRIHTWNDGAARLAGYAAPEAEGQGFALLWPKERQDELALVLDKAARGEKVESLETSWLRKDGRRLDVSLALSPLFDPVGRSVGASVIARDITARKQMERDLESAMEASEAFSYSAAHDLRAPLRHIQGYSQFLLDTYAGQLEAKGRDYLGRLREASRRMTELIDSLLALSRASTGKLERAEVDLSALALEIGAELQRDEGRPVEFVVAGGVRAEGDARLLRIVLQNLLGNAWKFTARTPRGRIEFGVRAAERLPAYFVRDNGAGFDMAESQDLFQPFRRLHPASEFTGSGIGLSIVQRIVRRHGGRVWAEARVGQGATFSFTLQEPAAAVGRSALAESGAVRRA